MAARTAVLSQGQLAKLAEHGEERRAAVGDTLVRVGDRRYPLIAIIEGEAAVLDQTGAEINRHGPGGFLAESSLLSGETCCSGRSWLAGRGCRRGTGSVPRSSGRIRLTGRDRPAR